MTKLYFIITLIIFPLSVFANEANKCGNNKEARALVSLIKSDKEQKRTSIRCNKILTEAAEAKAKEMSEFGLVVHNLGGSPNSRLRNAHYELPKYYGSDFNSNQVEAIAGGYSNAEKVWSAFKRSKAHKTHLLGNINFYKEQDEIGVAFIKKWESPHVEYWVVYLTKGHEQDQTNAVDFIEIPNKSLFILQQEKPEQ
jgi:uncharacterized protein YkwD